MNIMTKVIFLVFFLSLGYGSICSATSAKQAPVISRTGKHPLPLQMPLNQPSQAGLLKIPAIIFMWPVQGPIVKEFKNGTSMGIDIAGQTGTTIRSIAPGTVIYSGNGLKGYGNMLILKHDNGFLSVYAHNQTLLVKEHEVVKAGQKIAKMGRSGTDKIKLHFEIRYEGLPVNPLRHLPRTP